MSSQAELAKMRGMTDMIVSLLPLWQAWLIAFDCVVAALVLLAGLIYLLLRRNKYEDRPLGARAVGAAAK